MKHDHILYLALFTVLVAGFFLGVTNQASAWTYLDPLKETVAPRPEPTPPPETNRPLPLPKQARELPKRPIVTRAEDRKIIPQPTPTPPPPVKLPLRKKVDVPITPAPTPTPRSQQPLGRRVTIPITPPVQPTPTPIPQERRGKIERRLPTLPPTGQVPPKPNPKIAKQPLPKIIPRPSPIQVPPPQQFPRPGGVTERGRRFSRVDQVELQRHRYDDFNNRWQSWQIAQQQRRIDLQRHRRNNYMRYQPQYWSRLLQDRLRLQNARYYDNLYYNYGYWRDGTYYYTSQYGAQMIEQAINNGYEEGYREGQADRLDGWSYDPYNAYGYADGAYGYDSYYIEVDEYSYYFRQGFLRGYEDGYYRRYNYGHYRDGKYLILDTVLRAILTFVRMD